jgi:outer membrane protein insertion porin family
MSGAMPHLVRPRWSAALLAAAAFLVAALPASAQDEWEGRTIEDVIPRGFRLLKSKHYLDKLHANKGRKYTIRQRNEDVRRLYEGDQPDSPPVFDDVRILVQPSADPARRLTHIVVIVEVVEAPPVTDVLFTGLNAITITSLKVRLRVSVGTRLSMHRLQLDRDYIREEYLTKGYAFSTVTEEIVPTAGGVAVHWRISEGPLVSVKEVVFSGNASIDAGVLRDFMMTRGKSYLIFVPIGSQPFVRRYLDEDLKRIKLHYQLEGWLDIDEGERVFVEDLIFSPDRTEVTVKIHVDEGLRYRIRKLTFRGNTIFKRDQLDKLVKSKEGEDFNDRLSHEDARRIRDLYGENAYIMAEVSPVYTLDLTKRELDLVFDIKENRKFRVGRITVAGNHKTRVDVILRELKDFAPGEEFNNRMLTRGINRLRDRGYFEQSPQGVVPRHEEGALPDERDVVLDVREGETGSVRFAGGYSSSYGILGMIELTQRNFDIADIPSSFADLIGGTGFAGGGQIFSARLQPSAKQQRFTVSFMEPYFFGYEFGAGVVVRNIRDEREDWDEHRLGFTLTLDKRIQDWRFALEGNAYRWDIEELDEDAPSTVRALEGRSRVVSLMPSITWDTRDSRMIPSEGFKLYAAYEHAGDFLPGDHNFYKIMFDADIYFTILELGDTTPKMKHVLQLHFTATRMNELEGSPDVPFFERAYAGGRESIRGFENRGVGPKENGDPIGGEGYVFASIEYSFPMLVEFLRGAVFYDVANLADEWNDLEDTVWRQTVGFGIRFIIPQLGQVPVALDFGFPLRKDDDDDRQTVLFDIGKLF